MGEEIVHVIAEFDILTCASTYQLIINVNLLFILEGKSMRIFLFASVNERKW